MGGHRCINCSALESKTDKIIKCDCIVKNLQTGLSKLIYTFTFSIMEIKEKNLVFRTSIVLRYTESEKIYLANKSKVNKSYVIRISDYYQLGYQLKNFSLDFIEKNRGKCLHETQHKPSR